MLLSSVAAAQVIDAPAASDATAPSAIDAGGPEASPEESPANASLDASPSPRPDGAVSASGRLRGRVLAKGSRAPVVVAHIAAGVATADTDDNGQFDVLVPCGPHPLGVQAPGFETLSLDHDACADPAPVQLRLVPHPELPLYETVVSAQRGEPGVALSRPALTATPGSLGDPFRAIESLPGVATVVWPAPIYAIRGANPGNTGFFLDDIQMPALFHMALGPSVIHPTFFDSMTFYPGGYPAHYGRSISGLVTGQSRPPGEDRMHATVDVRLYDAGVLISVPWPDGNGGFAVAARYSYAGMLLSLLQNDVHLSYWDYQVRADRRLGAWRLTLLALGSGDDLEGPITRSWTDEYVLRFHRANLRASRSVGHGQLVVGVVAGADHSRAPLNEDFPIDVQAYSLMPRLTYQRPGQWVDWETGLDGHLQWFQPQVDLDEASASDLGLKRTAMLVGSYASATIRAGTRLTLVPGLRLDSYRISGVNKMDWGPRLSARLMLGTSTWLSVSGGRFSQPPSLALQIPGVENFGLALYGLQTSWQGALGIGTKCRLGVEVELTGYLQNYVLTDLRDPTLRHPNPLAPDFLVRRDAQSYGVELMIRRPASERLHGWLSYTLSQNRRDLGSGLTGPSDWDQRHIANAVLGYRIGRTTLGARGHLNTGRPYRINSQQGDVYVRLPAFYQLDLRAERRFLFDVYTLDLYAEVVNATLTREVYRLHQESSGEWVQRSYRIFLPSLGVRAEF